MMPIRPSRFSTPLLVLLAVAAMAAWPGRAADTSANFGTSEPRNSGTPELRNPGTSELRNPGTSELRNPGTSELQSGAGITAPPAAQPLPFVAHTIDTGLKGGYQSVVADLNKDGRPDVIGVVTGLDHLAWYENPGKADAAWPKHVMVQGVTGWINAAAHDIDGDGIPEVAVAHGFSNVYARSTGIVVLLTHQKDPKEPWAVREIDRAPTAHRLRWIDPEGNGRKVLVNAPLTGAKAIAPDYRDKVGVFIYRPPDFAREVLTDADEGVLHGVLVTRWDDPRRESLLTASFLGVFLHRFDKGQWARTQLTAGDPTQWPKSGSSDVAEGRLGRERYLTTIEPWHGNRIAVYRQMNGTWTRQVIDETIEDGHTIVTADFNGDGRDEIIVGERRGKRSAYLYRATDASGTTWSKQVLDDGDMAAAGCAVADLNADKRVDVVCLGTATANLKWYENK